MRDLARRFAQVEARKVVAVWEGTSLAIASHFGEDGSTDLAYQRYRQVAYPYLGTRSRIVRP